jgi:hypothetical protein
VPRRFLANIDLTGFALIGALMHPVTSDPAGLGAGDAGRLWYRTDLNQLRFWNGTTAINVMDLAATTGSITASRVSDFMTQVFTARLDQLAAPTADVGLNGRKITGLADGSAGSDAATYGQLLALVNNQHFKTAVRAASTANIANLAGGAPNTLDGVTLAANDRVLVKDQTAAELNGIYVVSSLGTGTNGTWTRASDADTAAELPPGSIVPVSAGSTQGDRLYMLTTDGPITIGTTPLTFSPYGASTGEVGIAGAGLTKTGSTYDVGQGPGILVTADAVGIDTGRVLRKWQGIVPTASGTVDGLPITVAGAAVTFNHGAGNASPLVVVRYGPAGPTPGQLVEVDDVAADANNVTITLPGAPAANAYRFMVAA